MNFLKYKYRNLVIYCLIILLVLAIYFYPRIAKADYNPEDILDSACLYYPSEDKQ